MNRRQSFIAHAQSAELMQPGERTFDHPSSFPQIATMAVRRLAI